MNDIEKINFESWIKKYWQDICKFDTSIYTILNSELIKKKIIFNFNNIKTIYSTSINDTTFSTINNEDLYKSYIINFIEIFDIHYDVNNNYATATYNIKKYNVNNNVMENNFISEIIYTNTDYINKYSDYLSISIPNNIDIESLTIEDIEYINNIIVKSFLLNNCDKSILLLYTDIYNKTNNLFLEIYEENISITEYEYYIEYIIKYPEYVLISDRHYKWPIKDLYVKIILDKTKNSLHFIGSKRGSLSYIEYYNKYSFSHSTLNTDFSNKNEFNKFCFGDTILKNNSNKLQNKDILLCSNYLDILEQTLIIFNTYIKLESRDGGPYCTIEKFYLPTDIDKNIKNTQDIIKSEKAKTLIKTFLKSTDFNIVVKSIDDNITNSLDYKDLENKLSSINTFKTSSSMFGMKLFELENGEKKEELKDKLRFENNCEDVVIFKKEPIKKRLYEVKEEFGEYCSEESVDNEIVIKAIDILRNDIESLSQIEIKELDLYC